MIKLKTAIIETIKLVIIFISTMIVFSYGLNLIQTEYHQRLREFELEKKAELVSLFDFF